jgi:hypothetical protein
VLLDPNLGQNIGKVEQRRENRRAEIDCPERRDRLRRVSVNGVDAVVHGHNVDDIVRHASNLNPGNVKRLRVNLSVDGECADLAEARAVHCLRAQDCLPRVGVRPVVIVV